MRKGWEYKKLGEVLETTSGGTPSKSHKEYYEGGTIPWLRSGEVSKGDIYDAELYITEEGLKKSSAKLFSNRYCTHCDVWCNGGTSGHFKIYNVYKPGNLRNPT